MGAPGPDPDLAHHRALWAEVNRAHTDAQADGLWATDTFGWGLFRRPEDEVGALGEVAGLDVVELGCGTAYVGAWLARRGAHVVALDLSRHQLASAARGQGTHGPRFPLVEGDGARLPFRAACADLVVSEYGVAPWCPPSRWLAEAARILRPGGRLVFLTNSVLAALCVPAEGGPAGDRLLRGPAEVATVRWPGGGLEHHPDHGTWIRLLRAAGFTVEALHELTPPEAATTPDFYEIVTADWARRWPAEDLWVATRG